MIAVTIYLLFVLLPGFLLVTLLGIYRQQLLFSVTFSCAALIVLVSMARNHLWGPTGLLMGYVLLLIFLSSGLLVVGRSRMAGQVTALVNAWRDADWRNGLLLTALAYVLWYAWTGPYTEVPADLYRHLEFTRVQLGYIEQESFGPPLDLWHLLTQHGGFWYVLIALTAFIGEAPLDALLYPLMGVTGLLFLLSVYAFGYRLTKDLVSGTRWRAVSALLMVFFVAGQLGTSAFSFVRYYSLAPVILNFTVFLAAQVCLLSLVNRSSRGPGARHLAGADLGYGLLWVICFGVALVMHNQEGLFVLLMALGTVVTMTYRRWISPRFSSVGQWFALLVSLALAGGFLLLVVMTLFDHAAAPRSALGKVVHIPWQLPGYGPLYILNPKFQFAETVAIWGALVILLFGHSLKRFRCQPWLVTGMLMPLATVFNPAFVDIYLRVEGGHSLWRLLFLMPLYAVAAIWIVWSLQDARAMGTYARRWRMATGLILILLVLPLEPLSSWNPHARITNLPVPHENSEQHWMDLIRALNELPDSEQVLTDPVTGYLLSALTGHRTFRYKFFADELYHAFPFVFDSYDDNPLSRYRGWLLVVNLRDGATSETGRRSGHWPAQILQVSRYYPAALRKHLADHPERFETIWAVQDIKVYRILR